MRKAVSTLCKEYLRLQYSSAQGVIGESDKIKCYTPEYFTERASRLNSNDREIFKAYLEIGRTLNTLLTYAAGSINNFLKGYFMLSASCALQYIRDSTPKGKKIPDYIPIKRIPDTNENGWEEDIIKKDIFTTLVDFFAYKAMMKGLSQAFSPQDLDFSDLTYSETLIEEMLSDLKTLLLGMFTPKYGGRGIQIFDIKTFRMSATYSDRVKNTALKWDLSKGQIPFSIACSENELFHLKMDELGVLLKSIEKGEGK